MTSELNYLGSVARSGPGACGDIEPSIEFYSSGNAVFFKEYSGYERKYQKPKTLLPLYTHLKPDIIGCIVRKMDFGTVTAFVKDMRDNKKKFTIDRK